MTTLVEQFQKTELVTRLWATLVPELPTPTPERLMRWAVTYDDAIILHAVKRLSKKLYTLKQNGEPIDADRLVFYADAVMASEQMRREGRE